MGCRVDGGVAGPIHVRLTSKYLRKGHRLREISSTIGTVLFGTIAILCVVQYLRWLGGLRIYRNMPVLALMASGVVGLSAASYEAWYTDQVRAGLATAHPEALKTVILMGGLMLATLGFGIAGLVRARQARHLARFLGLPEGLLLRAAAFEDPERLRSIAEARATRAHLGRLRSLLAVLGPQKALPWLSHAWIQGQLDGPKRTDIHPGRPGA